jgi:hypothetical protein
MSGLEPAWADNCQAAITLLHESRNAPVPQMLDLTDAALRKVVDVRDGLIERLRQDGENQCEPLRTTLGSINVALSEVASVQYPGALDRGHIDTAAEVLQSLLG